MNYVMFDEDDSGDIVDISYYCCANCFEIDNGISADGHAWPTLPETDYNIYCNVCDELISEGLNNDA